MNWIDTHAHLYDEQFDTDRDHMMQRALAAGVTEMYLPNCDQTTIPLMLSMVANYPQHCRPMVGLHPVYVKETYEQELAIVQRHLAEGKYVGVGEVGLDKYWDTTFLPQQQEAFTIQMDWALEWDLPVIIHSREATQSCIDLVRSRQNGHLRGIFHCFSGTVEEALQVKALGFFIGVGGVATFKKTNLSAVIQAVGLDCIVLETDAPYLAPVPHRGKRNESSYIPLVADAVSRSLDIPISEVAFATTLNAKKVFTRAAE